MGPILQSRGKNTRRRHTQTTVAVFLGLTAMLALSACNSPSTQGAVSAQSSTSVSPVALQPANVEVQPADGSQNISPAAPIKITVHDGVLDDIQLTNQQGKHVNGELSADKHTWNTTEKLGYGKTYTWSGTATGADGKTVAIAGSFSTLSASRQISGQLNIGDGDTVGVAMPIVLTFSSPVTDKASVERALSVRTSVPVIGSWAWLDSQTVHYRPQDYWPANTQVTVAANLYGTSFGGGAYGMQDVSVSFTVGRSLILRGNTQTHRLQVFQDGRQIADYPASYGLDSDPGRVTHSGTHVVMSKSATFSMSNPKYGYKDVVVPWAVRISNNGEFVHGYAPSIWAQGKQNVSHGCVNLAPANAKIVYDEVLPGDPVEISGSTQQLGPADGDFYDWTMPWDQWAGKSALHS